MKFYDNQPCIIMAFNQDEDPAGELVMVEYMTTRDPAHDIGVKQVQGFFDGVSETSYVCTYHTDSEYDRLIDLAFQNNQKSILRLDNQRNAYLYNVKNAEEAFIGKWVSVSEAIAKEFNAWTFDPSTNQYYITR